MIEMPLPEFASTNGIRMGYYKAGPRADKPPVALCHGWPEIAFSWRHKIKALSEASIRVVAPDQRGYGATGRQEPVEDYDLEHPSSDLVGLLNQPDIEKAIFAAYRSRGRRRLGQYAVLGSRDSRTDRISSHVFRRCDVHRAISGSGACALPDRTDR
jgi:hypothetical protein